MLDEAEKLFSERREKDAYEKVSQAVRMYLAKEDGLDKEITSSELIRHLKKKKREWRDVKGCLDMCEWVEFARYKPNKTDFRKIIKTARGIAG